MGTGRSHDGGSEWRPLPVRLAAETELTTQCQRDLVRMVGVPSGYTVAAANPQAATLPEIIWPDAAKLRVVLPGFSGGGAVGSERMAVTGDSSKFSRFVQAMARDWRKNTTQRHPTDSGASPCPDLPNVYVPAFKPSWMLPNWRMPAAMRQPRSVI